MSDFAFEVVGDASKANKAIDGVLANLDKIGARAPAVGRELTSAFDRAAQIVRNYDSALASNSSNALKNAQSAQQAARAHAAYIEQLQREQGILNSIHGPMQQYQQDVAALNSLLAKGEINAFQFNAQLAKAKQNAGARSAAGGGGGGLDVGAIAGSLPGGSIIAGAVGGGIGGAATAGAQLAIGAAGSVIEMADSYSSLNQRLKQLTGSSEEARAAYDKLHASANKTRTDIDVSVESFIRISRAMKSMNLTQDQVLTFNERLNESIAMSGASGASASAGMMQLSQALASGVLRGDEFNSMMENIPVVADLIAQHLHVSTGALRAMAENGQLTSKIIYDSVNEAGDAIDQNFAQTIPTVSQQVTVLKNDIKAMVGEMAQSADLSKATAAAFTQLKDAIAVMTEQTKFAVAGLDKLGISLGDLTGGGLEGMRGLEDFVVGGLSDIGHMFDKGKTSVDGYVDGQYVLNRAIAEGSGKLNEFSQRMVEMTLRTMGGEAAAKGFTDALYQAVHAGDAWEAAQQHGMTINDRVLEGGRLLGDVLDKLNEKHKRNGRAVREHTIDLLALFRAQTAFDEARKKREGAEQAEFDRIAGHGDNDIADMEKRWLAVGAAQDDVSARASALIKKNGEELAKANEDAARKSEESAQRMREAWANAAGTLAADLINAFAAGDISADKLLRKAALLALQIGAMQMGGSGGAFFSALAGGLGGGANGFDYLSSGRGLQLPGFATGGDMLLRGSGGTDSQLAMWWMTPGESLHVRTPEQRRQAQQTAGGGGVTLAPQFKLLLPRERRDIVDDSRQGMTTLVKLLRPMERNRR